MIAHAPIQRSPSLTRDHEHQVHRFRSDEQRDEQLPLRDDLASASGYQLTSIAIARA